jgi:hypothetical protein
MESTGPNPLHLRGDARGGPSGSSAKCGGSWRGCGPDSGGWGRGAARWMRRAEVHSQEMRGPMTSRIPGEVGARRDVPECRPSGGAAAREAQGLGGGQRAALPVSSTLTFTCAGPRQMLPAMTRPGSHGKASRAASVVKTAGEGGGTSGMAAGKPSSLIGMTGACGASPRPGRRWRRARRSWRGFECRGSFKLRCSVHCSGNGARPSSGGGQARVDGVGAGGESACGGSSRPHDRPSYSRSPAPPQPSVRSRSPE